MGTVADKLALLAQTKEDIKAAIEEKGQTVGEETPFSGYPEKIRSIGALKEAPATQRAIYEATRPRDWPVMPEPEDNELYLLFAVPDGVSSELFFQVTCTGTYMVETGNSNQGTFVPVGEPMTLESGAIYAGELFADDYTVLASDGCKMALIKISGEELLTWKVTKSATELANSGRFAPIHEIRGKMPSATKICCRLLSVMKYFSLEGPNQIEDAGYMFADCEALTFPPKMDTSNIKNAAQMFARCTGILAVSGFDLPNCVTVLQGVFIQCTHIRSFLNCRPERVSANLIFSGYTELDRLEFDPTLEGWAGADVVVPNTLGHAALVKLFESLPVITESHTITVINCRGAGALTEEEIAIATAKNWTVVKEATTT